MTAGQVEIRVTGTRDDCEYAVKTLRQVFQLSGITGPVYARYSWPLVHLMMSTWPIPPSLGGGPDD